MVAVDTHNNLVFAVDIPAEVHGLVAVDTLEVGTPVVGRGPLVVADIEVAPDMDMMDAVLYTDIVEAAAAAADSWAEDNHMVLPV